MQWAASGTNGGLGEKKKILQFVGLAVIVKLNALKNAGSLSVDLGFQQVGIKGEVQDYYKQSSLV